MADTLIQAEEAIRRALEAEHMVRGDWHTSESDTSHGVHDDVCNIVAVCSPANHMHPDTDLALSPATMLAIRNYLATVSPLNIRAILSGLDRLRSAQEADARDAARYRFLRDSEMAMVNETWPVSGTVWVVQYHAPAGVVPETRFAGKGTELDAAIDSAMAQARKEGGNGNSN